MADTATLSGFTSDQLAIAYDRCNRRALDATTARAATLWMNRRDTVRAEVVRRGFVVRRSLDGVVMVGRAADFNPIES